MASVLMIADDLTGALDSAAPFLANGLSISVALDPCGVAAAMADGSDMLVVNSDSRMLDGQAAAACMAALWGQLRVWGQWRGTTPTLIFKKIDSRLYGHPARETIALAAAAGRTSALICPAVPDMGRIVAGGLIMGDGIDAPIRLSDHFPARGSYYLADARDDAALDALAGNILANPCHSIAVGARGLAQAIARRIGTKGVRRLLLPARHLPMVIAIGSRDPSSHAQIDHLLATCPDVEDIAAPGGRIARHPSDNAEIILFRVTDDGADYPSDQVAARFAERLASIIRDRRPRTLFASGGATAVAIARSLDIHMARLVGEAAPAIPAILIPEWDDMILLTKSGSFGPVDTLSALVCCARAADIMSCGMSA